MHKFEIARRLDLLAPVFNNKFTDHISHDHGKSQIVQQLYFIAGRIIPFTFHQHARETPGPLKPAS